MSAHSFQLYTNSAHSSPREYIEALRKEMIERESNAMLKNLLEDARKEVRPYLI